MRLIPPCCPQGSMCFWISHWISKQSSLATSRPADPHEKLIAFWENASNVRSIVLLCCLKRYTIFFLAILEFVCLVKMLASMQVWRQVLNRKGVENMEEIWGLHFFHIAIFYGAQHKRISTNKYEWKWCHRIMCFLYGFSPRRCFEFFSTQPLWWLCMR